MIYTRIIGGLGNQLFQYAFARYLAEVHNTTLKMDISGYDNYDLHSYLLNHFSVQEGFHDDEELLIIYKVREKYLRKLIFRLFHKNIKTSPIQYINERSPYYFNEKMKYLNDNVYLDGYWNSEKYFKEIREILKNEFQIIPEPNDINKKFIKEIE